MLVVRNFSAPAMRIQESLSTGAEKREGGESTSALKSGGGVRVSFLIARVHIIHTIYSTVLHKCRTVVSFEAHQGRISQTSKTACQPTVTGLLPFPPCNGQQKMIQFTCLKWMWYATGTGAHLIESVCVQWMCRTGQNMHLIPAST